MRILLTEDNHALADLVKVHLGNFHIIDVAYNLQKSRYFLDTKDYDLLILDLALPDGNGQEICEFLKENKTSLPILFLTAELDSDKKVSCLQSGDDYLAKPFNVLELETRVKILLRKNAKNEAKKLKNDDLELNQFTHQVCFKGREIKLNRKEFLLLELFLKYNKQVLSKAILAERVWQTDDVLFGNTIEMTIANLRRKLGKNIIRTIKGVGYAMKSD